jgi:hypothetical protein
MMLRQLLVFVFNVLAEFFRLLALRTILGGEKLENPAANPNFHVPIQREVAEA